MNSPGVPFFQRQKVKESALILGVLLFFALYKTVSPLTRLIDLVVNPAVAGITVAYGSATTLIHKLTGVNLGFVTEEPDQEFLFSVRLATYVNERRAAPLLELATDTRVSNEKRERALRALLKFENTQDWVQPFLNELPKGGMLGLYDKTTPVLDELIKKIRAEGGLRQPLVRAYAEVVFSFMLQVPDAIIRQHSLRWVSDVLAEDALSLIVQRIDKETDVETQAAIEGALLDVRAVADPETARQLLVPFYKRPPWPTLRFPVGVALARLGYEPAFEYLAFTSKTERLSESEQLAVRVALARTRFPRELKISEPEQRLLAQRESDRRQQLASAMDKRERMVYQERMKRAILARRGAGDPASSVVEPEVPREPAAVEPPAPVSREAEAPAPEAETVTRSVERPAPVASRPVRRTAVSPRPKVAEAPADPVSSAETERAERLAKAIENRRAVEEAEAARRAEASAPATKPRPETPSRPVKNAAAEIQEARIPVPAEAPAVAPVVAPAEREAPKPFSVPGELTQEERNSRSNTQVASLPPEDVLPPALEQADNKPRSLMNYVDVVFEVKSDVAVYQNPGEKKSSSGSLPKGTKGKADFEVMIGEERWYQVKTKKGSGWVEASQLSAFNLSPDNVVPAVAAEPAKPVPGDDVDGERKESTYFEPTTEDVPVYGKPSEGGKVVGKLQMGTVYLAMKSEKVGASRWFLLQLKSGESGWVLGDINLQLANVIQPNQARGATKPLAGRNHEKWFAAGWVVAGVKGVGVYERQSIGSGLLATINPPVVYRVVETNEGGGSEWYRVELSGKKLGWVQAMDVKITKDPSK